MGELADWWPLTALRESVRQDPARGAAPRAIRERARSEIFEINCPPETCCVILDESTKAGWRPGLAASDVRFGFSCGVERETESSWTC